MGSFSLSNHGEANGSGSLRKHNFQECLIIGNHNEEMNGVFNKPVLRFLLCLGLVKAAALKRGVKVRTRNLILTVVL